MKTGLAYDGVNLTLETQENLFYELLFSAAISGVPIANENRSVSVSYYPTISF